MVLTNLGYLGLFIAAFLAATVVPFSSEIVYTALILADYNPWLCVLFATIGNWLGGLTCYWLGFMGNISKIEKWLKIKKKKIEKFETKFHKYGDWMAFFSFLPGVGDIIAVASGVLKCRLWIVALSMLIGKCARYICWMYFNGWILN